MTEVIKRIVAVCLSVFFIAVAPSAWADWSVAQSCNIDQFDESQSCYAFSQKVPLPGEFPYGDRYALIGFGCDNLSTANEWIYIGFDSDPNFTGGEIESNYTSHRLKVRVDKNPATKMSFTLKWGSSGLHFKHYKKAIEIMRTANRFLVQFPFYQSPAVGEFDLSGSTAAIDAARAKCRAAAKI